MPKQIKVKAIVSTPKIKRIVEAPKGEGPFGVSQTKLFKYIFTHPGCTQDEIKTGLFNDKTTSYVSNLLYENKMLITIQKFDNETMPSKYKLNLTEFSQVIDLGTLVKDGVFQTLITAE